MDINMKKIVSTVLSICIMLCAFAITLPQNRVSAAKPELSTMPSEQDVVTVVGLLGIMNGDYYGDLHLDSYVTRAEFTKMALCASSLKNSVSKSSNISPFYDIPASHWSVGYVITAVLNGYIRGYVDGSFKPNNKVTLEEAVTVMLRLLGYSELDSGRYPDAQLAKYTEMKLDNRISAQRGQALTRRECMYLIYNCLCAETKSGAIYCQTLGYSTDSNGRIDYLNLIGSNMEGPVTVDAAGEYTKTVGIELARATVFRDGQKIAPSEIRGYDQVYYNRDIRTLWCFSDKKIGTVNSVTVAGITTTSSDYKGNVSAISDSVTLDGITYRLGNAAVSKKFSQSYGTIKCDDFVMLMLDKDGNVGDAVIADKAMFDAYITKQEERSSVMNGTLKGPYTYSDASSLRCPFDINSGLVYLNGKLSAPSELRKYDVYYYSVPFNSVWAYRDSKTGIVDAVNTGGVVTKSENYKGNVPAMNDTVIVSGNAYTLGSEEVKYKFSAYGSLSVDDFVMLLLDKSGLVADAVIVDATVADFVDEDDRLNIIDSTLKGPYTAIDLADVSARVPFDLTTAKIYYGAKTIAPSDIAKYDVYYYSEPFKSVWVYRNTEVGIVDSVNVSGVVSNSTNYKGAPAVSGGIVLSGKNYILGNDDVKYKFSAYGTLGIDDFLMLLLDKDGNVADAVIPEGNIDDYIDADKRVDIMNSTLKGPYTAIDLAGVAAKVPFDLTTAKIYYGAKTIAPSDIAKYDVYYYSEPFKSVWVYRNTEIGIVDSVNVSGVVSNSTNYKGAPAVSGGIVLSGKNYILGNDDVKYKFSAYGTLGIDDFLMLLLDKDGNVADAVVGSREIVDSFLDEDDDKVALINSTLKGPYVVKEGVAFDERIPFDVNEGTVYYGTRQVDSTFIRTNDVYYYSEPFSSVWIYRDTATGFVNAISPSRENPTAIVIGTKTYTLEGSSIKHQFSNFGTFEEDDFVTVLLGNGGTAVLATEGDIYKYAADNDDGVTYADLVNQSMEGPVTVTPGKSWKDEIPFDVSDATFYSKNSIVDKSSVKDHDVIYYSKALRSVWIYSDKATGVYEAALPNRISPTSVTISGKTYAVESTSASFSLSNLGEYSYGDTVSLLLGKNGGVVDVIPASDAAESVYGFVTAFGEGTYTRANGTTYIAENISVLGIDTGVYTYEHDGNGFVKGDFVSVTYKDGSFKISKVTKGVSSAQLSNINSLISSGSFAQDASLMDVVLTLDANSLEDKSVTYTTFYPTRLSGARLVSSDIIYASVENGEISALVLDDFTGDNSIYGVVTAERSGSDFDYVMISGGKETVVKVNSAYGKPVPGAASFEPRSGKYIVKNLQGVTVEKSALGRGSCTSGGKTYAFAPNVEYYIKQDAQTFKNSTYEEITEGDYTITAYYDDTEEKGGRIRIIVAE